MMKLYLLMCSLSLAVGAAIGHVNGKHAAANHFVDDCATASIVVFRDNDSDARRHFHCFEIELREPSGTPVITRPPPLPMA